MATRGRKPRRASVEGVESLAWEVPPHLSDVESAAWDHLVSLLGRVGNLDRTDPMIVEAYAVNVGLLRAAQADLAEHGPTQEIESGRRVANPAATIVNSSSMRLKAICYDLGLVPATSKYAAEHRDDQADDPMARLLRMPG